MRGGAWQMTAGRATGAMVGLGATAMTLVWALGMPLV